MRWAWLIAVLFCAWKHYNIALVIILSFAAVDTIILNRKIIKKFIKNDMVIGISVTLGALLSLYFLMYFMSAGCPFSNNIHLCVDKKYLTNFAQEHKSELNHAWIKAVNICKTDPECDQELVDKFLVDANTLIRNKRDEKYKNIKE